MPETGLTLPDTHDGAETVPMSDHISKAEIRKDAVQNTVEAATNTVGQVANILVAAVGDVAKAIGGLGTDIFEIRDAARKAAYDHDHEYVVAEPAEAVVVDRLEDVAGHSKEI
jgi:hypothetical protein